MAWLAVVAVTVAPPLSWMVTTTAKLPSSP